MATLPWGWGGLAVGVLAPKLYVTDSFEATQVSTPNGGASASSAAGRRFYSVASCTDSLAES
jgi:hypothetical protein